MTTPARPLLALAASAAVVSALSGTTGAATASPPVGTRPATPAHRTVAAPAGVRVRLLPGSITTSSPDLALTVTSATRLRRSSVTVTSTGGASVSRRPLALGRVAAAGRAVRLVVGAHAPTGPGSITATLHGVTAGGARVTARSRLYVDSVAGHTIASISGEQVRLMHIATARAAGLISGAAARRQRLAVLGQARSTVSVSPRATCAAVCVAGTVRWTDHAGGVHATPYAPVRVYSRSASGAVKLLTSTNTDQNGAYSTQVSPSGQDIVAVVLSAGPGFTISSSKTGEYYLASKTATAPPNGTSVTADITAGNNEKLDNNTAFSVQNALVEGQIFVHDMNHKIYAPFKVDFPNLDGGSYYTSDEKTLYIDAGDRWDWDPTLHEFGHYVMEQLDIQDNPGDQHVPGTHESDTYHSKSVGVRLAWGEAWPTYFSLSLQKFLGLASLHVPNVGDDVYTDTEDQDGEIDPEVNGDAVGEDDELSSLTILWDLFDTHNDGLDNTSIGAPAIWADLKNSGITNLSGAYKLLAPGDTSTHDDVNCLFSASSVSPLIAGAQTRTEAAGGASPSLTWKAGNGGGHPNTRFLVEYRNAADGTLLYRSGTLTTTSYTAPQAQWSQAVQSSGGHVAITVIGSQPDSPVTGPYRGCAQTWTVG